MARAPLFAHRPPPHSPRKMLPLICCFPFALLLASSASSFSPPPNAPLPRISRPPSPCFANRADGERPRNAGVEDVRDVDVTAAERARVLSYRASIGASALLISIQAVDDAGFLEGTGFDLHGLAADQSTTALPLISGLSLLLCPVPSNRVAEIGALSLGIITAVSGLHLSIFAPALSWSFAILAQMAVSVREIWYFSGAYKTECGITLFMLPLMLDLNNRIPFTVPLCALGMSVLAGGKVFEPCREDLVRSDSEFMAK